MSKHLNFHQDGPVPVTEAGFKKFQDFCSFIVAPTFDTMFYAWLCERHSDNFRRLCIRNLLRQPVAQNLNRPTCKLHYYCYTNYPITRLFHIGLNNNSKTTKALYWTLYNRPKLLHELTSEFIYNLENFYYGNYHNIFITTLIELLITLPVSPKIRSDLWHQHPNFDKRSQPRDWIMCYLKLSTNLDLPDDFAKYLITTVSALIQQESAKLRSRYSHPGDSTFIDLSIYNDTAPGITYVSDWITTHCDQPNPSTVSTIATVINELEKNLSPIGDHFTYLRLASVINLAPHLPHSTTLALVKRHVSSSFKSHSYRDEIEEIPTRDLEWLRGFCAQYLPHIEDVQLATTEFLCYRLAHPDA